MSKGHVFHFNGDGPGGEFEMSGRGITTVSGWRQDQPVPCVVCGGKLTIVHEEGEK
jgi:hypothetical protein